MPNFYGHIIPTMTNLPSFDTFGERLQWWAEYRGFRQKDLAERAGMGQATLNELMKGKTKEPRAAHFLGLARELGLRPEYLLHGEGPPEATNFAQLSGLEAQLVMLFRSLPDDAKRDAMLIDLNAEFNTYQATRSSATSSARRPATPPIAPRTPLKKLVKQGS